jgi:uncharacterized protein (TIGR03437 family)
MVERKRQGLGVIVVYQADGSAFETNPNQFASAGDTLVIYCTGFGPVSPQSRMEPAPR